MKYSIGQIVKIKATGEKVTIVRVTIFEKCVMYIMKNRDYYPYGESELKPYCSSRTGKYRNKKGQFITQDEVDIARMEKEYDESLKELAYHASSIRPDSKQRNYQKISMTQVILNRLDLIEKKIDELGMRV